MLFSFVVSREPVDSAFDHDKSVLGVSVLSVSFQMFSDVHSFLNEVVEVFGDLGSDSALLEDSEDLVAGDTLDLGNTLSVSENDANLGGGSTLLGQLHNLLNQIVGLDLHP